MNWDAIGAVAEVVGALAVVATLLYLAVQIRQGSRAWWKQNTSLFNSAFRVFIERELGDGARIR